jgi:hypothetical protein
MKILGISPAISEKFVAASPSWIAYRDDQPRHILVDIEAARAYFGTVIASVSLLALAKQYALGRKQIAHLKLIGAIKPIIFPDLPGMVELYALPLVEQAMLDAQRLGGRATNDNQVPSGCLNLQQVSRIHTIEIDVLLNAILAGDIHCVRTHGTTNPSLTTWVDPVEAIRKILGFESPMTLAAVCHFLNLHFSIISTLAHNGILPSRGRPKGDGMVYTFERSDVEAFQAKYVTTSEVTARKLKIPSSIKPVEIKDPRRNSPPVRLYERDSLWAA